MKEWDLKLSAPAKINLALEILGKREDSYHDIITVFQAVSLFDYIYMKKTPGEIRLSIDTDVTASAESNLAYKAARLLKEKSGSDSGAEIFIEKIIPVGAGLGGGSSDAAATLKGLARLWKINHDDSIVRQIAQSLGADVPFFLEGGTAVGAGRGDKLEPIKTRQLQLLDVLLVCPDVQVSTRWAYQAWDERKFKSDVQGIEKLMESIDSGDIDHIARHIHNDFEKLILDEYPLIKKLKNSLLEFGAPGALLSGTGSSVFGIFDDDRKMKNAMQKLSNLARVFPVKPINRGIEMIT